MFFGLATIFIALWADQFSKYWLASSLDNGDIIPYGPYFNLVKVWNTGVSFSMFNNHGDIGRILLCMVAVIVCLFLLRWMYYEKKLVKIISLGLIIGGALGNVIDRIYYGAVLDFLDFHYAQYHWPSFNLADSFICFGASMLIILELFNTQKKGEKNK